MPGTQYAIAHGVPGSRGYLYCIIHIPLIICILLARKEIIIYITCSWMLHNTQYQRIIHHTYFYKLFIMRFISTTLTPTTMISARDYYTAVPHRHVLTVWFNSTQSRPNQIKSIHFRFKCSILFRKKHDRDQMKNINPYPENSSNLRPLSHPPRQP